MTREGVFLLAARSNIARASANREIGTSGTGPNAKCGPGSEIVCLFGVDRKWFGPATMTRLTQSDPATDVSAFLIMTSISAWSV